MTNPEFDLDEFLSDVSFGSTFAHILLFSILSYLHEKNLLPRVRALLSRYSLSDQLPGGLPAISSFISQIKPFFPSAQEYPLYVNLAASRLQCTVDDLLSHWGRCPTVPAFVNPFAKYPRPRPVGPVIKTPSPVAYDPVGDLEHLFDKCHGIDWVNGRFPASDFTDIRFGREGITQFFIEEWYVDFYNWAFAMDDPDRRQYVVMGTRGIGKSIFCLYFMCRLIASHLDKFHGYDYFDVSWKDDRIHYARITLKGKVRTISVFEFERDGDKKVFRLLDGWSYLSNQDAFPTLAILSPMQVIEWTENPFLHYAPSRRYNDYRFLEQVSTRYGFDDQDRDNPDYPASVYGTITSRMRIIGGNLDLLFGPDPLEELKRFLLQGRSVLGITQLSMDLGNYFAARTSGSPMIYHRLFACFSDSPFTEVTSISIISLWAESKAKEKVFSLQAKQDATEIWRTQNWLREVFGFNFLRGNVHGLSFENLCHALITRDPGPSDYPRPNIGEHHFELADWSPGCGLNRDDCFIEQVAIPRVRRIDGTVGEIPESGGIEAWYWVPTSKPFKGIDAIYYDGNMVYVIQMTVAPYHAPVSLKEITRKLKRWLAQNVKICFLTLVDIRDRQRLVLERKTGMIKDDPGGPSFSIALTQKVGVVCPGPVTCSVRSTLADFLMEFLPNENH
jgi:hypothetical protein